MAKDLNVTFNQATLNEMSDKLLDYSIPVTAKERYEAFKKIVKQAKIFNEQYLLVQKQISNYEVQLKSCIKKWHNVKVSLEKAGYSDKEIRQTENYKAYVSQRAEIREKHFSKIIEQKVLDVYKKALKMQNNFNIILGQRVVIAYVWVGKKKIPQTYLIQDMSDFLYVDVDKMGHVIVRYRNNANKLKEQTDKIEKQKKYNQIFQFEKLQATYSEKVVERYRKYKTKKSKSYILWLNPDFGQKWHGALVSSFGSINQAYAKILLHQQFNPSDLAEDDMQQFMNVVLKITNLKGVLQGDTQVQNMQMAIKSAGASTLDIQQIYTLTKGIVDNKLNNQEAIKNFLKNKKKEFKNEAKEININLQEALEDQINDNMDEVVKSVKNKIAKAKT